MPPSRNIRVAYCIDSFGIGGTELNAVRSLEALDRDRFEVTVFHLQKDGPIRARYDALGVAMVHVPITRLYTPAAAVQGFRMASMIRSRGIRVAHTHDIYTNIFAAPWAALLGGCRVIASRRWAYDAPRAGLTPLNRWSYRFATRVLANSPAVVRLLADEERVPTRKIVELPNFLEERAFQRVDPEARLLRRREWGIPDGAFVVGTVARLAPVKNHELLLRAAGQLDQDVHIVLVGDGPERANLERLARELKIQPRVHFLGQVISPINLHQFLDVSILCSLSEGFPNAVIEALAAERPVIATATGGITDVIVDGETGTLVSADDPQALACRIRAFRSTPAVAERLARTGMLRVRARYHQSTVIARLGALYLELGSTAREWSARLQ
jgi:glycosyltransferase involved in cell wall biosynthesis